MGTGTLVPSKKAAKTIATPLQVQRAPVLAGAEKACSFLAIASAMMKYAVACGLCWGQRRDEIITGNECGERRNGSVCDER